MKRLTGLLGVLTLLRVIDSVLSVTWHWLGKNYTGLLGPNEARRRGGKEKGRQASGKAGTQKGGHTKKQIR